MADGRDMIVRRPGQDVTRDTRAEARETLNTGERKQAILRLLRESGPMTAKELAFALKQRGIIPTDDRNTTQPRLTEMCKAGIVEPVGKTTCAWTHRTVALYGIREAGK